MVKKVSLKQGYVLSKCCSPSQSDKIVGYYSLDNYLKVHRCDCSSLKKTGKERLVPLSWGDILEEVGFVPEPNYHELDEVDFDILGHHLEYGIDYSLMLARMLTIPKQEAFERHKRLRELGLLKRVEPRMVQYRQGISDHKWIKHRNHTYYELTDKGKAYFENHRAHGS